MPFALEKTHDAPITNYTSQGESIAGTSQLTRYPSSQCSLERNDMYISGKTNHCPPSLSTDNPITYALHNQKRNYQLSWPSHCQLRSRSIIADGGLVSFSGRMKIPCESNQYIALLTNSEHTQKQRPRHIPTPQSPTPYCSIAPRRHGIV